MSPFDLTVRDGEVALITGAASGIGRETAKVFARAGYRVTLADLDAEGARDAAGEIRESDGEALVEAVDVTDETRVAALVETIEENWGRLDFVFNNAGIVGEARQIEELEAEDLRRVLAVNLEGPFLVCKHAVPLLRKSGGGSVLNISSITAEKGSAVYTAYAASKAGVVALTRGLARRVGRYNIRINCLRPGSVAGTDLMAGQDPSDPVEAKRRMANLMRHIPLGRVGRPRDIAHLALFLASPLARHIHGAVLTIDGGELLGYQ